MKSPGGSSNPPRQPEPQGGPPTTQYGQASPFDPQYQSILPVGPDGQPIPTQTAMLSDPMRTEGGAATPLLKSQQAQPMAGAPAPGAAGGDRDALARLVKTFGLRPQDGNRGGSGRSQGAGNAGRGGAGLF